jgi:uncharacterized protein (DUF1684 family)
VIRISLIAALTALALSSCDFESKDPYIRKIDAERFTKDSLMRHDINSPLPLSEKRHLVSLAYFDISKDYILKGRFEPLDSPVAELMRFSKNDDEEFFYVGDIRFKLNGMEHRLKAYNTTNQSGDTAISNILFVPFFDATNGNETFEDGRYMYVHYSGKPEVELDFNRAENPNCAYTRDKSCPFPPEENRVKVRVEAGEMKY